MYISVLFFSYFFHSHTWAAGEQAMPEKKCAYIKLSRGKSRLKGKEMANEKKRWRRRQKKNSNNGSSGSYCWAAAAAALVNVTVVVAVARTKRHLQITKSDFFALFGKWTSLTCMLCYSGRFHCATFYIYICALPATFVSFPVCIIFLSHTYNHITFIYFFILFS